MWDNLAAFFSVIFAIFIMVLVLVLAYFTTKLVGRRMSSQNSGGGNIKILDRAALGQDKALLIVQTAGKTMLVGVTAQHIEKLCDIDAENLAAPVQSPEFGSFSDALKKALKDNFGSSMEKRSRKKGLSDDER